MRIWIDTEFDGYQGQLLSIALVANDGSEFYEVFDTYPAENEWVIQNVVPVLGKEPISRQLIQLKLSAYLSKFLMIRLIADWPDDVSYFCQLLITGPGTAITIPTLKINLRNDLNSSASLIPHNALADARAIRDMDFATHKLDFDSSL